MKKILKSFLILAGVIGGLLWGWAMYESHAEREIALARLREVSALTGRILAMNKSETVSFAEYIKRSDQSLESIESSLVALKAHRFSRETVAASAAIEFSLDAQGAIRELAAQARTQLRANIAGGQVTDALKDIESTKNKYVLESSLAAAKRASDNQLAELGEVSKIQKAAHMKLGHLYSSDYKVKSELGQSEGLDSEALSALTSLRKQ